MGKLRKTELGHWTDGNHQFVERFCESCSISFLARKDKATKFCSRDCRFAKVQAENTFELNQEDQEILNGLLLSDGCISKSSRAKNYQLIHASIHEEYSDFLSDSLSFPLRKSSRKAHESSILGRKVHCKKAFYLRTRNSPTMTSLHNVWYTIEGKQVPQDLPMKPLTALHWFLGDGSLDNERGIWLCTDSFNSESLHILTGKLEEIGVESSVAQRNRILIPNRSVFEFFEFIGPCPLSCFAYKWDSIVKQSYKSRKCKECRVEYDTETNSRYFCSDRCYQRNWKRNGPTLRAARENHVGEEVQGSTANKVGG